MKTGILASEDSGIHPTMTTMLALLRIFTKEALEIACKYVEGQRRNKVNGEDMKDCIKFVVRNFVRSAAPI